MKCSTLFYSPQTFFSFKCKVDDDFAAAAAAHLITQNAHRWELESGGGWLWWWYFITRNEQKDMAHIEWRAQSALCVECVIWRWSWLEIREHRFLLMAFFFVLLFAIASAMFEGCQWWEQIVEFLMRENLQRRSKVKLLNAKRATHTKVECWAKFNLLFS